MSDTINEDGTPVLIEAVYYRYHSVYAVECDSVEEAAGMLEMGADHGDLADVGVFVDGRPRLIDCYVKPRTPSRWEAAEALDAYAKVRHEAASGSCGSVAGAARGTEDGPDQGRPTTSPRPVSTTRAETSDTREK